MLMVAPERETPGTIASAWALPMRSASRSVIASETPAPATARRSATNNTTPMTAMVVATSPGALNTVSAHSSSSLPTIAAGMEPTTISSSVRASGASFRCARPRAAPAKRRHQSPANAASTATSVPTCSATSKARLWMGQPSSQGTTIRWPELLIGRNSPRPCRMPSQIACAVLMPLPGIDGFRAGLLASRFRRGRGRERQTWACSPR